MRIVKPSVELIHHTPNPERVIERCGRVCYQSMHKVGDDTAIAFIRMIRANGHESMLEHASAGFSIVTDRGVTHEIVRHRLASYSQESTRYCNYSGERFGSEISVIEPLRLRNEAQQGESPALADGDLGAWYSAVEACEHVYLEMLSRGVAPQIARSVLPSSLKAEICMTANFREWRHFLRLRTSPKAHPQMREVAEMIRAELMKVSPVCFEDIP